MLQWIIYDAYAEDFEQSEREKEKERKVSLHINSLKRWRSCDRNLKQTQFRPYKKARRNSAAHTIKSS